MASAPTAGAILVTGGAGYVGSHYVLEERSRGTEVIVLDNLVHGHREAVLDVELVVGDITDRAGIEAVLEAHSVRAVVHFAAFAYVGESVSEPAKYYRNNVAGTLTLLEAMRAKGVEHLVFSSSCVTYGNPEYVPIDEAHPQRPVSPYGETKQFCERMLEAHARAYGLRFVALRYFNASGAHPSGQIGESHDPETHLIPLVLQVAAGKREHVDILGTDYDTPDGTCIRDYVHVSDLARAHIAALDHLSAGGPSGLYNLGTSKGNSVREVIASCERVSGKPVKAKHAPRRAGDPPRLVATAELAKADLGWSPQYTELDAIVETAWRWERDRRY